MENKFTVKRLSLIGLMAALCFAASMLSVNIPTAIGNTRLHLGNVLCLTSGILLGPLDGGLSAGIGSMFFDLMNPLYIATAPFTLVFKFVMAFVCGGLVWRGNGGRKHSWGNNYIAAAAGAISYVMLYLGKNFFQNIWFLRTEIETALIDVSTKAAVSGFNAVLAVVAAVPLAFAVRKGLERSGVFRN